MTSNVQDRGQSTSQRAKGQKTCYHHQGKEVTLYCTNCGELVCVKCVTSVHQSHTLEELGAIIPQKREELQTYVDTNGNIQLLQLKKEIASAEEELKKNAARFKDLATQAKEQGDKLKAEIDISVTTTVAMCKQIEDKNAKMIMAYKKELETRYDLLNKQIQDHKKVLQKATDIQLYDTEVDLQFNTPLPANPALYITTYVPNKNPKVLLEEAMGTLTTSDPNEQENIQNEQPRQRPTQKQKSKSSLGRLSKSQPSVYKLPSVSEYGVSIGSRLSFIKKPLKPSPVTHFEPVPSPRYRLMDQPTILSEFASPCKVSAICCTNEGDAWVCFEDSKTLTLLQQSGTIKKQHQHQVRVSDIRISPTTQNLWVCSSADKSLIELPSSGIPVIKFQTDMTPKCLCLSTTGFVVVGMSKEIAIFTTYGRMVSTSRTLKSGSGVTSPKRITECGLTNNLAVVDHDLIADGGQNKRHVLIVDKTLHELHRFRGDIPLNATSADAGIYKPFNPSDVCYDKKGNLVVGDCTNRTILLLSGNGEFISILSTNTWYIVAVGMTLDDVVWGVYRMNGSYDVKLLQYTTVQDTEDDEGKVKEVS